MDVELEHVPSQIGTAILNIRNGSILKVSGELDSDSGRIQCGSLYQIMLVSCYCFLWNGSDVCCIIG